MPEEPAIPCPAPRQAVPVPERLRLSPTLAGACGGITAVRPGAATATRTLRRDRVDPAAAAWARQAGRPL